MIGRVIGNYKITGTLGAGGMGTVYKGVDQMVDREVAIKMLRPEVGGQTDLTARFRAEAVSLAKVSHPNVATLYSFFNEGDEYFMVMELVRGANLEDYVAHTGRLPLAKAVAIFAQAAEGIASAHQRGVLHRDIKPANIMITDEGVVKVMDFGIARALRSSRMTRDGRIVGTVEYMAPERIEGNEDDARSDIYSLGIVLFELITGRLPFVSDSEFQLMRAHLSIPAPSVQELRDDVPPAFAAAVSRSMVKNPAERYASATEFRDAVVGALPDVKLATASELAASLPRPAAAETPGAAKATRMAAPSQQPAPPTRAAATPSPPTRAAAVAPRAAGFSLGSLGWKHYAAAASVLVVLLGVLGWALLSRGGAQEQLSSEEPAGTQMPGAAPLGVPENPTGSPASSAGGAGASSGTSDVNAILGASEPIRGDIPGLPGAASAVPSATPARSNVSNADRRRRALEALGETEAARDEAKKMNQESERRDRALDALGN